MRRISAAGIGGTLSPASVSGRVGAASVAGEVRPVVMGGAIAAAEVAGTVAGAALEGSVALASGVEGYQGPYEVTPTREAQVLGTAGRRMASDVVINPIPRNYGLITWNGSTLTVS